MSLHRSKIFLACTLAAAGMLSACSKDKNTEQKTDSLTATHLQQDRLRQF
jgi:thiol:disulfide interchange protein DsbC